MHHLIHVTALFCFQSEIERKKTKFTIGTFIAVPEVSKLITSKNLEFSFHGKGFEKGEKAIMASDGPSFVLQTKGETFLILKTNFPKLGKQKERVKGNIQLTTTERENNTRVERKGREETRKKHWYEMKSTLLSMIH